MTHNIYVYILLSGLVSYIIRVTPLTLIRRPIRSTWIRSFLYYVPYATLAVMTFPAIVLATNNIWSGIAALAAGIIVAWLGGSLIVTASCCCIAVLLTGLIL